MLQGEEGMGTRQYCIEYISIEMRSLKKEIAGKLVVSNNSWIPQSSRGMTDEGIIQKSQRWDWPGEDFIRRLFGVKCLTASGFGSKLFYFDLCRICYLY